LPKVSIGWRGIYRLVSSQNPEGYIGGSVASDRASLARQIKEEEPD